VSRVLICKLSVGVLHAEYAAMPFDLVGCILRQRTWTQVHRIAAPRLIARVKDLVAYGNGKTFRENPGHPVRF